MFTVKKDIANRITEKRTEKGWNKTDLALKLGISSAAVGQYELGNTYPKMAILFKLKEIFNWDFINDKPLIENSLNENGVKEHPEHRESYSLENSNDIEKNAEFYKALKMGDAAPYLENVNASAGLNFLTNNGDPTSYIKIPGAGVDAYINVFGDSMYPKYCAGEIIGVKEVHKEDLFFGHAFVIQMADGEAYIKYILPGKDDDHWNLESENPKYPPRQFHLSKITKIFKIKTTVTKNSL